MVTIKEGEIMRNIYSLNLIAWLSLHNVEFSLKSDNNRLWFAVVANDDEVNDLIELYKEDIGLQAYLDSYRALRSEIDGLRK